jgi:hypothetical protein
MVDARTNIDYEAERLAGEYRVFAEEERIARENEAREAKRIAREQTKQSKRLLNSSGTLDFEAEGIARPCRLTPGRTVNNRNKLLRRQDLQDRPYALRRMNSLIRAIENDLGGRQQVSAIEGKLIEAFAGAAISLDHLNALIAAGHPIDQKFILMFGIAANTLTKVAQRLGTKRVPREVATPTLNRILAEGDNTKLGPEDDYQITTIEAEADDGTP